MDNSFAIFFIKTFFVVWFLIAAIFATIKLARKTSGSQHDPNK